MLESRFARSISLLTGALPAQYGFQTAGVLDIQTKTGLSNPGMAVTMYGGSLNWLQPSFEYGGHEGPVDWFLTGDYLENNQDIENPASTYDAIHDSTQQLHGLLYMSGIIDPDARVSVVGGAFDGQFQIPNNPGQLPSLGLNVLGTTSFNSNVLNEVQHESAQFGLLSLQKHVENIDMQISAFVRNSVLSFSPDPIGDLLFNGVTPFARRSDLAEGVQADASWRINESHTLRGGFLGQVETTSFDTTSFVLPVDATGAQTSNVPLGIIDNGARTGGLYGVYLQDEWRISPALTLNSGLRFDGVNEYTNETQLSPRVNLVLKATDATTVHAGYSRYFVPPPFELVAPTTIALFNNTTAASAVQLDNNVKAERSHYFDVGINQILVPSLSIGLDGYYKLATNLIDEGQFGAPIILSAFNYARAYVAGGVFTLSYDQGPWSIYGNAAYSRAMGTDIISAQFNFAPDELAYIAQNYIHLD
ncbi:MAG TPA: TonB-dependent receptor, partial [Candidatus Acidoferrales bacterium]|nr:TonB-dependent receptor [Candidatus Acidoferrales bacterium]